MGNTGSCLHLFQHITPIGEPSIIALHDRMAVQPDNLVEQLGAKAVHHAHHNDQRRDSKRDGHQTDGRDQENEALALAWQQISLCDHAFISVEDHAGCFLRSIMGLAGSIGASGCPRKVTDLLQPCHSRRKSVEWRELSFALRPTSRNLNALQPVHSSQWPMVQGDWPG